MESDLFHKNVRQAREQAGLTQAEMAEELGVGRTTYIAFEVGRTRLFNRLVDKMAARLGKSPEALLYGDAYEDAMLREEGSAEEWRRAVVDDYEQRLSDLKEQLDSAQRLIESQSATIRTLNESLEYMVGQLRRNE